MNILRIIAIALFSAGSLMLPAAAQEPFSFDTAPGRLPKDVRPTRYTIAVTPDIKTMRINGRESIALEVRKVTSTIQFNSLNERLADVRFDGITVSHVVTSDSRQLTTLSLARPATRGQHVLTFSYRGRMETAPDGMFYQPYVTPDGKHGALISTQLEATDARRFFPCWDEPAFRARFALTTTMPAAFTTIGNMPIVKRVNHGPLATTTFETTPPMPTYLVELTAGDMASVGDASGKTPIGVWAVKGQEQNGRTPLRTRG
jgi:aminopeptidase N